MQQLSKRVRVDTHPVLHIYNGEELTHNHPAGEHNNMLSRLVIINNNNSNNCR